MYPGAKLWLGVHTSCR